MTKKRVTKQAEQNRKVELNRIQLYKVLSSLRLLDKLDQDKVLKRMVLEHHYKKPTISIVEEFKQLFADSVVEYFNTRFHGITLHDAFYYAVPMLSYAAVDPHVKASTRSYCATLRDEIWDIELDAVSQLGKVCAMFNSFTAGYPVVDREINYKNFQLKIYKIEPDTKRILVRDGYRTVHRPYTNLDGSSTPIPSTATFPWHTGKHPVYLQDHAVRRLYERLDVTDFQPLIPLLVGRCLHGSIATFYRGKHMFPISLPNGCKLGYLVAEKTDHGIICHTFLFLTMDGTPEGDELYKRLRISRVDAEYNRLDRLSTFVLSDLYTNPTVLELMGDIVGLLDFAKKVQGVKNEKALDLLSYLGISDV